MEIYKEHLDMVGVGGSSPLGHTKNSFKNATLRVAFLFLKYHYQKIIKIL